MNPKIITNIDLLNQISKIVQYPQFWKSVESMFMLGDFKSVDKIIEEIEKIEEIEEIEESEKIKEIEESDKN